MSGRLIQGPNESNSNLLVRCMAHRTNLTALDATKAPNCKELLKDIDEQHQCCCQVLQEVFEAQKYASKTSIGIE